MAQSLVPPELPSPVLACISHAGSSCSVPSRAGRPDQTDLLIVLDDDAPAEQLTDQAGLEARRPGKEAADVIPCREDIDGRFSRTIVTSPDAAPNRGHCHL